MFSDNVCILFINTMEETEETTKVDFFALRHKHTHTTLRLYYQFLQQRHQIRFSEFKLMSTMSLLNQLITAFYIFHLVLH